MPGRTGTRSIARSGPSRIQDVASAAGVSTATVSRALRGLDRVSPDTRARVMAAAADLHYVASPHASSLKSGKTGIVGVVVPFFTRWFFAQLIEGAEACLREQGYNLLVFNIGNRGHERTRVIDRGLLGKRFDGLLVLSADLDPPEVDLLRQLHLPIVTVGLDLASYDHVGIDDVETADLAMSHLLALGHTRIAYVGGNPAEDVHVATAVDRMAGVRRALRRAQVSTDRRLMVHADWTLRGGLAAGLRLLDRPDPPTAILAASDEMAIGVLCAARQRGVDVPGSLSVMGIDDHEMSFTHDLSTVRQPVAQQGCSAAALLLDALAGRAPHHRRDVILPTVVVQRGSTAPASAP